MSNLNIRKQGGVRMTKLVRLSDIAEKLGVSVVTVSNALSGKAGVSNELRQKIEEQAEKMGYIKARSYANRKMESYHIGVLVSERFLGNVNTFYWELYQKFANTASKESSFTMLEVVSLKSEQELQIPALLRDRKIDGMVVIGTFAKAYIEKLGETIQVPLVFLDAYVNNIDCDCIVSDNYDGMYQMTNYLINQGHTQIAFVGNILATTSIMDRYMGFYKAMLEHGIEVKKDWLIFDRNVKDGKIKIGLPKKMPTAFACNCDLTAEILIQILENEGYRIPDDISVIGYDNFTYFTKGEEKLTTYCVDTEQIAIESFYILVKRIRKVTAHVGIHIVPGKIIIRNSVKRR